MQTETAIEQDLGLRDAAAPVASLPAPESAAPGASSAPMLFLLAVQATLFAALGWNLWDKPHYQFFPLAAGAAVLLAVFRLKELRKPRPGYAGITATLVFFSLALQTFALMFHSYWLIGGAFFLTAVSLLYSYGGIKSVWACWPSLGLIAICVPLPLALDLDMVHGLRNLTTFLASGTLNTELFRLPHLRYGNTLDVNGQQLFIAEACSGVNSLFSTMCCVLIWAGFSRLGFFETLALLLIAIVWLIVANTLRVILVALGVAWWNVDLMTGWRHELLGIGTYALALFLTWDTRQFVLFFTRGTSVKPAPAPAADNPLRSPRLPGSPARGWAAIAFATAAALGFFYVYRSDFVDHFADDKESFIAERLNTLAAGDIPSSGNGWKVDDFKEEKRELNSILGAFSRTWPAQVGRYKASVSVDYPFVNWHDLAFCYSRQGWEVEDTQQIPSPVEEGQTITQMVMSRTGQRSGYLIYGMYDPQMHSYQRPAIVDAPVRPDSLAGRLLGYQAPSRQRATTIQIQVLVFGIGEFDEATRKAAQNLYKAAYEAAAQKMK